MPQPSPGDVEPLCIAGPTAAGKSTAALAVAEALGGRARVEIVSVDSALVYRGMDIGTAKPGSEERNAVAHHLIDIVEPSERYSAARFVADARAAIAAVRARGAMPLLVGGTMLYFKALFDGLDALPEADRTLRAELDERAARAGWPALHKELAAVDPASAARIAPNDSQRIQRALEVQRLSGRPLSAWHTAPRGRAPPLVSLEPGVRGWLHARIGERFAAMLDAGFVDEVRTLRSRGDLDETLPSMRAVGYRQAWAALDRANDGAIDRAALAASATTATRQLAKRQMTWLRAMPQRVVVAADDVGAVAQVVAIAERLFIEGRVG